MKTALALLLVGAFACGAVAQTGAAGGGGRGQGRGGFGRGMGGGMQSDLMLLGRTDVQADLNLTDDQKTKVKDLRAKMQEESQSNMANMQASGQPDQAAMQKMYGELQAKYQKQADAIINSDQTKRLHEIGLQLAGNRAIMRPEAQKDLALTDEQKNKISGLETQLQDANRPIRQKERSGEIDQAQAMAERTANQKVFDDGIAGILTAEQKAKLETMKGKPFKADPNIRGGRGGGGGGGGV